MTTMSNDDVLKAAMTVAGVVEESPTNMDALKRRFDASGYSEDYVNQGAQRAQSLGWIDIDRADPAVQKVTITEAGKSATANHYNE